jgi:hypothetical protein
MIIIGAGLAGLLAANMLRRFKPTIWEAQMDLPNNHDALLRFRSDAVSRATGIPFRKVWVQKAISSEGQLTDRATLRLSNLYSRKVSGEVRGRSIMNMEPGERWIAPRDFIRQMANSCSIQYNHQLRQFRDLNSLSGSGEPVLSTIPMPAMMQLVEWPEPPEFNFRSITSINVEITDPKVDVFQTIYYPGPDQPQYRASMTGNLLTVELCCKDASKLAEVGIHEIVSATLGDFGLDGSQLINAKVSTQRFGKISPIPTETRKQFILSMTDRYGIYSVGRFATWRQLLLDDVVEDIRIVEGFISDRDQYRRKIAAGKG